MMCKPNGIFFRILCSCLLHETYWVAYARGKNLEEMDIFRELTEIVELQCPILEWVDVNGLIFRVFEMLDDRIPISGGHKCWPL